MKALLTTLNSKYIHTALSLQYLYSYCKDQVQNMALEEYTINHSSDYILAEIYKGQYDVVCFSCYIWNIAETLRIVKNLKKVNPKQIIILGGPEVSFDPIELMDQNDAIDYIVFGEGEKTFKELLHYLVTKEGKLQDILGIVYRANHQILKNDERPLIKNLSNIPSPYFEDMKAYENKIIYYESSRGCPHNCKYCLSSTIKGVRFFPLSRVKKDLDYFLQQKVKQVKFVDRTFNAKKEHSLEIMRHLAENDNGYTNFHFEITADLLDDETLDFLSTVREGLFQFEVGVQTTYDKTMESIDRKVDFHILSRVVKKISDFKNIHLHLDLIAGLPYEGFERFKISFDEVYALKPEKLQLGFLKLLKGSPLRSERKLHEYIFRDEAPYEILENRYISYHEILKLKMMEEMVEIFYNSKGFYNGIHYILANFYDRPSSFYQDLGVYWEANGYHNLSHGRNALYEILINFYQNKKFKNLEVFKEILKLDYLAQSKSSLPSFFNTVTIESFQSRIHAFLQDEANVKKFLPKYEGMPAKQIIKKVHFENFKYDVTEIIQKSSLEEIEDKITTILFDYDINEKVFTKSRMIKVNI